MCEIASLAILGMQAGSAIAGAVGQSQAAHAQAQYQNQMYSETGRIAHENFVQQTEAMGLRSIQENAAASEQAIQNRIAAIQTSGYAQAVASDSGLTGNSVNVLMEDYKRQEAYNAYNLRTNLQDRMAQMTEQLKALRAEAQSRINQATPGPVAGPSLLATGLQIGSAAFGAYDYHQFLQGTGPYNPNKAGRSFLYRPLFSL